MRRFALAAATFVWGILLLDFVLGVTGSPGGLIAVGLFFGSFTILANLFAAIAFTAVARDPSRLRHAEPLTAVALYLLVVTLIYLAEFHGALETTGGLAMLGDAAIHDIIPLLYLAFWFVAVPKGTLGWRAPFLFLIFPLAYLVFIVVQGAATGHYAYPFLDIGALGAAKAARNAAGLLGVYLVLGFVFEGIDCAVGAARRPAASA